MQLVDPSNLLIDRDNALAIAAAAEPYVSRVGQAQVFATILTDPTTLRGDQPVRDRHIWLVRYSGFAMTVAGPPDYETGRTSSDFLRVAYVLIDGDTGEWISTRLESG